MDVDIAQHDREMQQNREHWRRKPILGRIYGEFYREIAARIDPSIPGSVVELGSGMGNIKAHLPHCVTTDLFPNPWLDRVENAYALSFAGCSVGHLILFDVWHHLEFPGTALAEFQRVLVPDGKLIIFDPAMGLLGRIVFGLFHHEPLGLGEKIQWDAPAGFNPYQQRYYAAQGNASRIFGEPGFGSKLAGWRILEIQYLSAMAYLASGGMRGPQLYPSALFPVLSRADRVLSRFPSLASRMLVVLSNLGGR